MAESSGKTARQMPIGKRFQPGVSGNPGGRPRKTKLTDAAREWLESVDQESGRTNAELVVAALGQQALKGDAESFRALADRSEGRPMQSLQVENVGAEQILGTDLLQLNRGELREYAETGRLPVWFQKGSQHEAEQPS